MASSALATTPAPGEPTVFSLKKYLGVVPSMQVRVGDRDVTFLLDTAGGLTVLAPQTARSLGCGIDTPKGRLWMQLDCGSDGSVIVNRPVAAALGLDPDSKKPQELSTTLGHTIQLQASARIDDLIVDGNIGAPVLKRWIVTMDLAHSRLWLAPATHDGHEGNADN